MADDRQANTCLLERLVAAQHSCLYLQQVLCGFHQNRICASLDHAECGLDVVSLQVLVRGVTQGRQLGTRAERTHHETGHPVRAGAHLVCNLAGDLHTLVGQLLAAILDAVISKVG